MNIIHATGLRDVGPFENVQFKILPGIMSIYGLNRTSGRASKNSNGVGKSLMLSSLSDTFNDEPIIGERGDRLRTGSRAVSFTPHNGKRTLFRRTTQGPKEKIEVIEDGGQPQVLGATAAKQYLSKVWPITPTEYNTFVHIDSRLPHPLVMGTSADRKQFFTEFFGLDRLDAERKLYTAELRELNKVRAAFDELYAQYKRTQEGLLTADQAADLADRRDALADSLASLQERVSAVQGTVRLMQFGVSAKQQIDTLVTAYGEVTQDIMRDAVADNAWELKDVEQKLSDARAWDQYQRDNARYIDAFNALSEDAKAFLKLYGREEALEIAREAATRVLKIKVTLGTLNDQIEHVETLLKKPLPEKVVAPEEDEQDLRTLKNVYEHHLTHANKFEDGKCETCGQPVKIKDPAIVRKKLKAIEAKLEQHEEARNYQEILTKRRDLKKKAKALDDEFVALHEERLKHLNEARLYKVLRDLPAKPEAFTGKKLQTEVLERMKSEIMERRELLRFVMPHVDTIIEFLALTNEQIESVRNIDTLAGKMNSVQEKYTQVLTKLEVNETVREQLAGMKERLRTMKKQLRDEPYVRLLVQGYSDKNIKKIAVEAISERLMSLVNTYSAKIFQENFRFEFVWDSEVRLLVHRQNGKTTDVRKLSGAESVFFTLILVCALLNFVPAHKRCSLMILDEPSAHMSAENVEILQELLKILNTMIPSIVVITPHSDEIYEGAQAFTVVKRNGVAKVVKGMPHEIKD